MNDSHWNQMEEGEKKTMHKTQQSMMKIITDCPPFIHSFNYPKDLGITTFGYRPNV